jgi:mediator of RNA polymerase II transcription subunit 14
MQALTKIEQSAVSTMSYLLANEDLTAKGVDTAMRYVKLDTAAPSLHLDDERSTQAPDTIQKTLPSLMVRFSQLLKAKSGRFANELLQLQYLGFDTDVGQVKLVAKGRMRNPSKVQDILQRTKDSDVTFSVDGSFSMVVATKLGTSPVNQVIARLNTLSTLCNFAKILKERGFECKDISFSKVCFKYAQDQEVTLVFAGTEKGPRIKLEIGRDNPHRRVTLLLEEILNDPELGFERFTMALEYFLPVLRAFQTLESSHASDFPYAPIVHPRQVDFYRLTYPNPNNQLDAFVNFDLTFKRNKDDLEWRVSEVSSPAAREERNKVFPGFNDALLQFMKRVGTGWTGMTTLLVANKGGIEDAILELDRCVWGAMQQAKEQAPTSMGTARGSAGHEVITID